MYFEEINFWGCCETAFPYLYPSLFWLWGTNFWPSDIRTVRELIFLEISYIYGIMHADLEVFPQYRNKWFRFKLSTREMSTALSSFNRVKNSCVSLPHPTARNTVSRPFGTSWQMRGTGKWGGRLGAVGRAARPHTNFSSMTYIRTSVLQPETHSSWSCLSHSNPGVLTEAMTPGPSKHQNPEAKGLHLTPVSSHLAPSATPWSASFRQTSPAQDLQTCHLACPLGTPFACAVRTARSSLREPQRRTCTHSAAASTSPVCSYPKGDLLRIYFGRVKSDEEAGEKVQQYILGRSTRSHIHQVTFLIV